LSWLAFSDLAITTPCASIKAAPFTVELLFAATFRRVFRVMPYTLSSIKSSDFSAMHAPQAEVRAAMDQEQASDAGSIISEWLGNGASPAGHMPRLRPVAPASQPAQKQVAYLSF
jgi:hypothetical protein